MKSLILFLLLGCYKALAADVQLSWDASPTPGVTNYMLYAHTNALAQGNTATAVVKRMVGTNLTTRIEGISGIWWFTVTAWKDGLESEPSNIVIGTWAVPARADAPLNMRFADLFPGPYQNGYFTPYFRLRW